MAPRRRTAEDRRHRFLSQRAATLLIRTDHSIAPLTLAEQKRLVRTDDPVRYRQLLAINEASPDSDTFWTALAVERAFHQHSGVRSIAQADNDAVARFITATTDPQAQLLRRTCLISCSLALAEIGQERLERPRMLVDPPQLVYRSDKKSHARDAEAGTPAPAQQRAATNDEILAVRLAVPLTKHQHQTAVGANVAIATSGATQSEVPQVRVRDISPTHRSIELPGRHTHDPDSPHFLPPRWVDLDEWSHAQVHSARQHLDNAPAVSLGYRGTQALTDQAARTYCGKAVNAAIEVAGLHGVWGLAIGSLGLWRLVHTALHSGDSAAATRYGAHAGRTIDKLLRQLSAPAV